MKNILLVLFAFPLTLFSADLAVHINISASDALPGDTVHCTISILNEGATDVSNIALQTVFAAGLKFQHQAVDGGIYNPKTKLWSLAKINATQAILKMSGSLIVYGEGPLLISAELLRMGEPDADSSPGNQVLSEDDMAYTCISVPIVFCGDDGVDLTAEAFAGFEGYQWKYENEPIIGATARQLRITKPGHYTCDAKNTTFSFPVVVEQAPAFSIELGESKVVCAGERIRMTVIPTGGTKPYKYTWTNDKGYKLSKPLRAGQKMLLMATVRDARGCVAKDTVHVSVKACKQQD